MYRLVTAILLVAASCTVERNAELSLGDFDSCPDGEKVFAVDPVSGAVLCAEDNDTLYEAGFGIDIADEGNPRLIELDIANLPEPGMPLGARHGLLVSKAAGSDIMIGAGRARAADNQSDLFLETSAPLPLNTSSNLDIGGTWPPVSRGWYWVFLIRDANDVIRPILVDRSTAPNDTTFKAYRLLAAVYYDDSRPGITPFRQTGGAQSMVLVDVPAGSGHPGDATISEVQDIPLNDYVPPGTTWVSMSVELVAGGNLTFVDPVVGAELPALSSPNLTLLRATAMAPVGQNDIAQYKFTSAATTNQVIFQVTGYEWGPQETLEITQ
jgi:hypothetical protein